MIKKRRYLKMDYNKLYETWLENANDEFVQNELKSIADDPKAIEDRFYRELEFGTGGMRGVIGAGTNRINIYNVRRATQGLAEVIKSQGQADMDAGVLIAHDTRNFSDVFALETAKVLCANGIKVLMFDGVHAVPEASFGIRNLKAAAGVVITASHNPKEYNGYKIYGPDGGQFPPDSADKVLKQMEKIDVFTGIKIMDADEAKAKGLLNIISKDEDEAFLDAIQTQSINPGIAKKLGDSFKIVYTPFHGTGSRPVKAILKRLGFDNVIVVKEQDVPDGNFPTVKSPNPEDKEGFTIAIELAKANDVDLIIGTDPDCDRAGIVVRDSNGEYRCLTGNQVGALLCEYIMSAKQEKGLLTPKSTIVKTIVTTRLASAIAKNYNAQIVDVLTGFKYIGEKMTLWETTGTNKYEFGFEESYGYLAGMHARDKDGVVASMLIAEMAAWYKTKGMSLYEGMQDIYKKYGYYAEKTVSVVMKGKDGMAKIQQTMDNLHKSSPTEIAGYAVCEVKDYLNRICVANGKTSTLEGFPLSDVLEYSLDDGVSYVIVRPSGTEPKVKMYFGTMSKNSMEDAEAMLDKMYDSMKAVLE